MSNNKTNQATALVSIIRYKDVRDKELLYLVIEKDGVKVAINIGQRSWETLEELINHTPATEAPTLAYKL